MLRFVEDSKNAAAVCATTVPNLETLQKVVHHNADAEARLYDDTCCCPPSRALSVLLRSERRGSLLGACPEDKNSGSDFLVRL